MGVITGILATVAKDAASYHNMRKWSIQVDDEIQAYVSSATKAGHGRTLGNIDWSGSVSGYGHTPPVLPGQTFVFHGSLDGVKGVSGTAMAGDVEIVWDIENGRIIEHTVQFGANGVLTLGAEAGVADTTVPDPPTSRGTILKLTPVNVGSPVEVTLPEVRTMRLKLMRSNQPYLSSSLAGQKRRAKGNFDAELTVTVYTDDLSTLPQPNDVRECKLYVDATTFWHLKWMRFGNLGGVDVDREGAGLIGATLNAGMTGYTNVGAPPGTPTEGFIKTPATAFWWPEP